MFLAHNRVLTTTEVVTAAVNEKQLVGYDGAPAGADAPVMMMAHTDQDADCAVGGTLIGLEDMIAGGPIAKGDQVISDADGKPVTIGAGLNPFGRAMTAAAVGERVSILINVT